MDEKSIEASKMAKEKEPQSVTAGSVVPLDVDDIQSKLRDPFLGSTQQHPFATLENAEYWSNVYGDAKYEGRHRFDPACQWDATEEKRLVRKVQHVPSRKSATLSNVSRSARYAHHGLGLDNVFFA